MTPEANYSAPHLIDRFDQMLQHLRALEADKAKAPGAKLRPANSATAGVAWSAAYAWHLMLLTLAGNPPSPPEPARPVNGLRHTLFTRQAGAEGQTAVIWRIVRGKPVKVDPPAPKASNGAGLSG